MVLEMAVKFNSNIIYIIIVTPIRCLFGSVSICKAKHNKLNTF
jgi:hypothetical protein